MLLSWAPSPEETAYIHVYAVFRDAIGSLSAITSTLTDAGINVHRVTAFVTTTGIAIDTFEVDTFESSHAEQLRERLGALVLSQRSDSLSRLSPPQLTDKPASASSTSKGSSTTPSSPEPAVARSAAEALARMLPPDYMHSTTRAERLVHLELFRRLVGGFGGGGGGDVLISWGAVRDGTSDIVLHVVFRDAIGSLALITSNLNAQGINIVRVAAYSTSTTSASSSSSEGGAGGGGGGGGGSRAHGIAIDTFRLSTFDRPTAKLLRSRLSEKLRTANAAPATASSLDASSVVFRTSWSGSFRGSKKSKQELIVGDVWLSIGGSHVSGGDVRYVQLDHRETSQLHLCFSQSKRTRTIVLSFLDGGEHAARAHVLLSRMISGEKASVEEAVAAAALPDGKGEEKSAVRFVNEEEGYYDDANAKDAPPAGFVSLLRRFGLSHRPPSVTVATTLLLAWLLVLSLALAVVFHSGNAWAPYNKRYEHASCIVRSLEMQLEARKVPERCDKHGYGCYFYAVWPAWSVDVRLLTRVPDHTTAADTAAANVITHLAAPLGGPDLQRQTFRALALRALGSFHLRLQKGEVTSGACAGRVGWGANRTLTECASRSTEWMPLLQQGGDYACFAASGDHRHGALSNDKRIVYFNIEPPAELYWQRLVATAAQIAAAVLTLFSAVVLAYWTRWLWPARPLLAPSADHGGDGAGGGESLGFGYGEILGFEILEPLDEDDYDSDSYLSDEMSEEHHSPPPMTTPRSSSPTKGSKPPSFLGSIVSGSFGQMGYRPESARRGAEICCD